MRFLNDKVYIHELIEIIGTNRARYMHHMAANWSPMAQEDRHQLCYGIWGVVGSTGRWPQVVNIWEEDGFDGLARSLRGELSHDDLQEPKLAKWWDRAASMRSGGLDRLLLPAPWMSTVEEATSSHAQAEVYAHEIVGLAPKAAKGHLERTRTEIAPVRERFGWYLLGAWRTAMRYDDECVFVWAVETWDQWAAFESAASEDGSFELECTRWPEVRSMSRFLMVDAPLSPLRTGRQPQRSDRTEEWAE
jgi:hypothetical protein